MKKYKVIIADQTDQDLRGIFEYIAFELLLLDNAAGQLDRLEAAIEKQDEHFTHSILKYFFTYVVSCVTMTLYQLWRCSAGRIWESVRRQAFAVYLLFGILGKIYT